MPIQILGENYQSKLKFVDIGIGLINNHLIMNKSSYVRLTKIPGYVSVDMDGNFVCAADLDKIVVWNSKNGELIKVIPIVPHYNSREDPLEAQDRYCWKGRVKEIEYRK